MKCPNCKNRNIDISLHSDGFVSPQTPVKECPTCGQVWTCNSDGQKRVIKYGVS